MIWLPSLERIIRIINFCDFVISVIWKGLILPREGAFKNICEPPFNNLLIKLLYLKLQDAYVCQNLVAGYFVESLEHNYYNVLSSTKSR